MSRILKASHVKIDENKRVCIEIANISTDMEDNGLLEENQDYGKPVETLKYEIIEQARKQANALLKQAEEDAAQILRDVKTQSAKYLQELEDKSRTQGYEAGYQVGLEESGLLKEAAEKELQEAREEKRQILEGIEEEALAVMIKILDKLLADSLRIKPEVILTLIRQGFRDATITGDVFVRVSMADYDFTVENKDKIFSHLDGSVKVDIIKDLSLNQGDCIIETPFGNIDCSLDQQYQSLKENLYFIFENR